MDKSFYARSNFNECTVVCHNDNFTFNLVTNFEVCIKCIPWVWLKLLETEGNTFLFVIKVKDNNVKFLVERYNFFRVAYATPRKVCDVDKTIYAAKVNEYTVRGDVLNGTFKYLTFFKFGDDVAFLLFKFCFDKSLVRNNNVFEFFVDFNNLEFHSFAHEYVVIADRLNINL